LPFAPGTTTIAFEAVVGDEHRRQARGAGGLRHRRCFNACAFQIFDQRGAIGVVADLGDHRHGIAEPRSGNRLVRALAARRRFKTVPDQRLPDRRNPRRAGDQIHCDAADDHDWLARVTHDGISMPQYRGASATAPSPAKKTETSERGTPWPVAGAPANSRHTNTPQQAEIMVAP
jgi:hypothetical protein